MDATQIAINFIQAHDGLTAGARRIIAKGDPFMPLKRWTRAVLRGEGASPFPMAVFFGVDIDDAINASQEIDAAGGLSAVHWGRVIAEIGI